MRIHKSLHVISAATLAIILVVVAFLAGAIVLLFFLTRPAPIKAAQLPPFPTSVNIAPASLLATAAIIYDPTDGRILFAKDPDQALPLASLTKLMTAQVILGSVSPDTDVTITAADLAPGGDWNGGLKVGDVVSVASLLKVALIASSNDAIASAVSSVGPDYLAKMNASAQSMGLTNMYFLNPTGLDIDATTSGAYGSAYDVARLAANFYAHYPQYFELTEAPNVSVERDGQALSGVATAAPLLATPGFIAAKTGYTDLAGGNLVVVFDVEIDHPLVAVVLGSTEDGRFTDMLSLIKAARSTQAN
jgi:D-alanyl-D-alanine carboxypeptidase